MGSKWVAIFACGLMLAPAISAADEPDTVVVSESHIAPEYPAYAQVMPQSLVELRTSASGVVGSIAPLPGKHVTAGEQVATLGGPDYLGALKKAEATRAAAKRELDIARQNYPHFSSADDVAKAQAAFKRSKADYDRIRAAGRVLSPCSGVVLDVRAANGERLAAGATVVTLQPDSQLWLRATFYGDAVSDIHPGMKGQFLPAGRSTPITVKVVTTFAALAADGGESVAMLAVPPQGAWRNGEYGKVTLNGPTGNALLVPTRALILDHGQWWVMMRTAQGVTPQKVVPGVARGWQTVIRRGLKVGDRILVQNAYLDFHRAIARRYSPPD